jgi:hypothetical protein
MNQNTKKASVVVYALCCVAYCCYVTYRVWAAAARAARPRLEAACPYAGAEAPVAKAGRKPRASRSKAAKAARAAAAAVN